MKRSRKKHVLYIQVSWMLLLKTFEKYFYHQVSITTQFQIIKRFLHLLWNIPIIQGPAGSIILFWNHLFSFRERFSMTPFCPSTDTCTRACNPKCPNNHVHFDLESPDLMWYKISKGKNFYCGSQFAKISELSNLWRSCCPAHSGTN